MYRSGPPSWSALKGGRPRKDARFCRIGVCFAALFLLLVPDGRAEESAPEAEAAPPPVHLLSGTADSPPAAAVRGGRGAVAAPTDFTADAAAVRAAVVVNNRFFIAEYKIKQKMCSEKIRFT